MSTSRSMRDASHTQAPVGFKDYKARQTSKQADALSVFDASWAKNRTTKRARSIVIIVLVFVVVISCYEAICFRFFPATELASTRQAAACSAG